MSDFDEHLRRADPGSIPGGPDDPLLKQCRKQWRSIAADQSATIRRAKLKPASRVWRTTWVVAATFVIAIGWLAWDLVEDQRPPMNNPAAIAREMAPLVSATPNPEPPVNEPFAQLLRPPVDSLVHPPAQPSVDSEVRSDGRRWNRSDFRRRMKKRGAANRDLMSRLTAAGPMGSSSWRVAIMELAADDPIQKLAAISQVSQIDDPETRRRGFELVLAAAGRDAPELLNRWMTDRVLGPLAWQRVVLLASNRQLEKMSFLADTDWQIKAIANRWLSDPTCDGLDFSLMRFADPDWQPILLASAGMLHPDLIEPLIKRLRGDRDQRVAAAALLITNSDSKIDQIAIELISQGRHRQAAYTTLLARQTPPANEFLQGSRHEPTLRPSLYSASVQFASLAKTLALFRNFSGEFDVIPKKQSRRHGVAIADLVVVARIDRGCSSRHAVGHKSL